DAFAAISIAIGFLVLYANPLAIPVLAETAQKVIGS
ncbi:F0F1 ATP synthase subunit C, partial [Francisella tularensis subsp. holarctica]|nr:F0F1 ATP synthase subunit C [Francisella tularensis subsp. holarctica]